MSLLTLFQMKSQRQPLFLLALGAAALLSSCSTPTTASLDAKTETVLDAMCAKLASAKTLQVQATRETSPGFLLGVDLAEKASGLVSVQRPQNLIADLKTEKGLRTIGFDGRAVVLVDHAAGTHARVEVAGDIDKVVRAVQERYGVTPPVVDLLVNKPKAHLLQGVTSGQHTGTERVAGVECDRLAFHQDGLDWQLWVATGDHLPRRIRFVYQGMEGGPERTATAMLSQWKLDGALPKDAFQVAIPSGSHEIQMIPVR
jgi:hypothetical protein